ncbi:MAG TPA: efflux transporter outer membrane subunit, partial [Steroidobacteraceae bacterium]|nr:efflux transporter outer membrane subunit [Steroidobacteraceae bacterium]
METVRSPASVLTDVPAIVLVIALVTALAILPSGCAVGPRYHNPAAQAPAGWSQSSMEPARQAASTVNADAPVGPWWTAFDDSELSDLISRSRASNLDLRAAVLRITEARAERDISAAAAWPSLSANASFIRQRLSESTPTGSLFTKFDTIRIPGAPPISVPNPYNQWQLGLAASWEPDLFGRIRRSIEAADADVRATAEDRQALLVSLDSDVARAYIDLRGAQLRGSITQANLATQRELLELTQQRQAAGVTTDLDVQNAAAEVSFTEAQLPPLRAQITADINQLSRLMGREPDALRSELDASGAVPPVPPRIPIGLPADLARRRPDIRAAEQRLHAATARIGVAMADLFPRLTLSAGGGFQSQNASDLIEW